VFHVEQRQKEPALKAGAFASAFVALLLAYRLVTAEQALAWGAILAWVLAAVAPLVQAWYTRHKVMPVDTVKAAGLDPAEVNRLADDRSVQPFNDKKDVG
jgi:hypothetical protein